MIALDTNAVIRMLTEDDVDQAKIVRDIVTRVESISGQIMILSEVLLETVWVLESVYHCTREEISRFLESLVRTATFTSNDTTVIKVAISQYKKGGDFSDLILVNQAKRLHAKKLLSFDMKLQKVYPAFVVESIELQDL